MLKATRIRSLDSCYGNTAFKAQKLYYGSKDEPCSKSERKHAVSWENVLRTQLLGNRYGRHTAMRSERLLAAGSGQNPLARSQALCFGLPCIFFRILGKKDSQAAGNWESLETRG